LPRCGEGDAQDIEDNELRYFHRLRWNIAQARVDDELRKGFSRAHDQIVVFMKWLRL